MVTMNNQDDNKAAELNNLSEQEQDERQKKIDKFTPVFDSFIDRVNEGLTDVHDDIRELAEQLEAVIPKFMVSGEIKKRVKALKEKIKEANKNKKVGEEKEKEILITDDIIDKALSSEYKELTKGRASKKKITVAQTTSGQTVSEESTSHLKSEPALNDDKKTTEETSTTINKPTNTTPEPEYDEPPEIYDHIPEPPKNQFEILNKQLAEKDTQIKNLENQLKITRERKLEQPKLKSIIKQDQLVLDDGRTFDNTIYLHRVNAIWIVKQITDYLQKFPELKFFLVQQDNDYIGTLRLNLTKPQFITGNPH